MNILTFDTEEWYIEKAYHSGRTEKYQTYDRYLNSILDLLDEQKLKATFFCVGGLAKEFPEVVKKIAGKGHEIGCHSNAHQFLYSMDREQIKADTETAVRQIEDVTGRKVLSYRAPAFSIGENNKWVFEILAECGIERDSSIYPAVRDFGGFAGFPAERPCIVKVGDVTLKEFPIALTTIAGRQLAYSGGGYFRFFPLGYIKKTMREADYAMTYFHIGDLEQQPYKMMTKEDFEAYFHVPGSFKNRLSRMIKTSLGTKKAFDKMCKLVRELEYVNLDEADKMVVWEDAEIVELLKLS